MEVKQNYLNYTCTNSRPTAVILRQTVSNVVLCHYKQSMPMTNRRYR